MYGITVVLPTDTLKLTVKMYLHIKYTTKYIPCTSSKSQRSVDTVTPFLYFPVFKQNKKQDIYNTRSLKNTGNKF